MEIDGGKIRIKRKGSIKKLRPNKKIIVDKNTKIIAPSLQLAKPINNTNINKLEPSLTTINLKPKEKQERKNKTLNKAVEIFNAMNNEPPIPPEPKPIPFEKIKTKRPNKSLIKPIEIFNANEPPISPEPKIIKTVRLKPKSNPKIIQRVMGVMPKEQQHEIIEAHKQRAINKIQKAITKRLKFKKDINEITKLLEEKKEKSAVYDVMNNMLNKLEDNEKRYILQNIINELIGNIEDDQIKQEIAEKQEEQNLEPAVVVETPQEEIIIAPKLKRKYNKKEETIETLNSIIPHIAKKTKIDNFGNLTEKQQKKVFINSLHKSYIDDGKTEEEAKLEISKFQNLNPQEKKNIIRKFESEVVWASPSVKLQVEEDVQPEDGGSIGSYVKTVIYGRDDYPPKVRNILEKYGNQPFNKICIYRTPLSKLLMGALALASGNTIQQKINEQPYEKLYHLFMSFQTPKGKVYFEKNEVINAFTSIKIPKDTEIREINSIPSNNLTINEALDKTKTRMGDKFFKYQSANNNCQVFILNILQANNIGSKKDYDFIKQDTESLFKGNSLFRKIANTVTDIGAKVNEITQGSGFDNKQSPNYEGSNSDSDSDSDEGSDSDSDLELKGGEIKRKSKPRVMNKKPNRWIMFVKDFAKKHKINYHQALKHPNLKDNYKKGGAMPSFDDEYVAENYDAQNLGVSKAKKSI
jgi:hypothetical protein